MDEMEFINLLYKSEKLNIKNEIVFHTLPLNFKISGLSLKKSSEDIFSLNYNRLYFEMLKTAVVFDKYNYKVSFDSFMQV